MPIYEYCCEKCNEVFSVYQSINAGANDTKCPKCGTTDVKKRLSTFSCCSAGGPGASTFSSPGGMGGGFGGG